MTGRFRSSPWLAGVLVALAGAAVYWNSLDGVFVFDDLPKITEDLRIRRLWPLDELLGGTARPLLRLTLALNYQVSGLDPWSYHVFNIAVHVLTGLTLLALTRRLLQARPAIESGARGLRQPEGPNHAAPVPAGDPQAMGRRASGAVRGSHDGLHPGLTERAALCVAAAASLLWVVHPLTSQAVSYVTQRAESLASLLILLAMYLAWRGMSAARRGALWQAAAVLAAWAAATMKEQAAVIVVLVLLMDRAFSAGTLAGALRRRWPLYFGLASNWAVIAGLYLFNLPQTEPRSFGFGMQAVTPLGYLQTQPAVLLHYLKLAVWPFPQCLDYLWAPARSAASIALPAAAVILLVVCVGAALRRWPRAAFPGACLFILLAPSSSIVPVADIAVEHRMYLPLACVVLGLVLSGRALLQRLAFAPRRSDDPQAGRSAMQPPPQTGQPLRRGWIAPAGFGLVALSAAVLAVATVQRNRVYHSTQALWADVVRVRPGNGRGLNNLGEALHRSGRLDDAIERYRRAIAVLPKWTLSYVNLGKAYHDQGRMDEAAGQYRAALAIDPATRGAHLNLGCALLESGDAAQALAHLQTAVEQMPQLAEAHYNLGRALSKLGRHDEALPRLDRALTLDPALWEAWHQLGTARHQLGQIEPAIAAYRQALALNPNAAGVALSLGTALWAGGRIDEAAAQYERAITLDAASADAHYNLALLREQQGDLPAALQGYRRAIELRPADAEIHNSLGVALIKLGRPEEAIGAFRRAIELDPGSAKARQNLDLALSQQRRSEEPQ